jgi:aryl-alcohol dehydrogenase-like predicted oxidoreductase
VRFVEAAGVRLSVIGLGTWQFGSREWGYGERYALEVAPAIVARALELRINLIDTAELYGFGRSERIVGHALRARREEAFVATKLLPLLPVPAIVEWRAVESAARLGVDHIDLYQLHWPNPIIPMRTPMPAMTRLRQIGLVRHVGVSNYSLEQWRAAEAALGAPIVSNQVDYSLAKRSVGDELSRWAAAHDRIVIAYSPLAQGFLSGRYRPGRPPPAGVRKANPVFLPENLERGARLLEALAEIAAAHGATSAQVALAWLISRPSVVVIPGASSIEQLEENAAAADLELTADELARLDDESSRFAPRRDARSRLEVMRGLRRKRPIGHSA